MVSARYGLARDSELGDRGFRTAYWSRGYMVDRAAYVRRDFRYYHCFRPDWFVANPLSWRVARWNDRDYWRYLTWIELATWCELAREPIDHDYGDNLVVSDGTVWYEGNSAGTPAQYTQETIALAARGAAASPPPEAEWKALGVFALVQGEEKTSNALFQMAVDKSGVIRGNYYDGFADKSAELFGQIDKKTQRAAWTIGKKTDRVFEAGAPNLARAETPALVHTPGGAEQVMLVRVEPPAGR
jgi:hypothetical protein